MTRSLGEPAREAAILLCIGCILGLGFNAVTRKGVFADSQATPSRVAAASDSVPTFITYAEASAIFTSGKAVWVDARSEYDYQLGHVKGAINIPLKEFDDRRSILSGISKDTLLITYCDGAECNSSIDLGTKLSASGFTRVKVFFGGWKEWQANGQPIEQ